MNDMSCTLVETSVQDMSFTNKTYPDVHAAPINPPVVSWWEIIARAVTELHVLVVVCGEV